jgi:zinc transporter 2
MSYQTDHSHSHEHAEAAVDPLLLPEDSQRTISDTELDRRAALRRLQIATVVCGVFFVIEVIGGLLSGSLAVLSDAAHLLADLASFAVAIGANYLASLPSTTNHTFGLKRTESLAALFSMVSLAFVCIGLAIEALKRLYYLLLINDTDVAVDLYKVDGKLMSVIAAIGVLVNVVLALVLGVEGHVHMPGADGCHDHGHEKSHSHEHSHEHGHNHATEASLLLNVSEESEEFSVVHNDEVPPPIPANALKNVNLQAAYLHVIGDLAQSAAVLIAGLIIWLKPGLAILDPICTLGFCIMVFCSTIGVVKSSVAVLLEAVPPRLSWTQIHLDLDILANVSHVHDLHIWSISDGVSVMSVHASATDDDCARALIAINDVARKHNIHHITAQVQPASIEKCVTCQQTNEQCLVPGTC